MCGSFPGAAAFVYAMDSLDDPRFLAEVGACGAGTSLQTLQPMNALAEAADLESVRYLMVCRPFDDCQAADGNLLVDAVFLTWRQ